MRNIPFFKILCCLLLSLPLFSRAQVSNDRPEVQVANTIGSTTAFTDDMYATMDWSTFIASDFAKKPIDYHNIDYNLLNAAVFYYTNKFRESKKMKPLMFSPQLRDAAVFQSMEMVNHKFYAHINPSLPAMRDPLKRAKYFKYPSETVGENIAQQFLIDYKAEKGFNVEGEGDNLTYFYANNGKRGKDVDAFTYGGFAEQIVIQWINSPHHRENMLNKDYSYMGCGIYASKRTMVKNTIPTAFGTQEFGGTD